MPRWKHHCIYAPIAIIVYVIGVALTVAAARVSSDGAPWFAALQQSFGELGRSTFWLPFVGLEVLAVEVAHHDGNKKAAPFFVGVGLIILWLIYDGVVDYRHAMSQHKWTAAALSAGFIEFWSAVALIFGAAMAGGTKWNYAKDDT